MITREFGVGAFADVVWWEGHWVTASHEGPDLVIRHVSGSGMVTSTTEIPLGSSQGLAFPRLWADGHTLWLAYRACTGDEAAMLARSTTGTDWVSERLTPAEGNHPVSFGRGWVAWQDKASRRILRLRLDDRDEPPEDAGPWCSMGLSRILSDGRVITQDADFRAQAGVTRPCYEAEGWVVAEHPAGGVYALQTASLRAVVFSQNRFCFTPRAAGNSFGQLAVATWGNGLPILLALIEPGEVTAEAAIVPDPRTDEFDVMGYVLGDLNTYPHMTANGEPWDVVVDSQKKLITHVLASDPTHTQVWRFDDVWLYLHWDGHKGQNPLGYTYTDGRWLRRMMRVGEKVDCPRNRLLRYSFTGEYREDKSHGLPYSVTLVAKYLAYPCGALGMRPAIEWHYAIGDTYREVNISVEGWGLYQWSSEDLKDGVWVTRDKGLPFDRQAPASARVVPSLPPLPTTIFPIIERPPKIRVTSEYPRPITGKGVETIITWEDENDPKRKVRVWLENGGVRVRQETPLGADTTRDKPERYLDLKPVS